MQRITRQRLAVLGELKMGANFRSAQQVHEDLAAKNVRVGLATVYRNLQNLAAAGTVDTLPGADGQTLYRWCSAQAHHHHLICRSCGHVEEIAPGEMETWLAEITDAYGFAEVSHSVEIFGVCSDCQLRKA